MELRKSHTVLNILIFVKITLDREYFRKNALYGRRRRIISIYIKHIYTDFYTDINSFKRGVWVQVRWGLILELLPILDRPHIKKIIFVSIIFKWNFITKPSDLWVLKWFHRRWPTYIRTKLSNGLIHAEFDVVRLCPWAMFNCKTIFTKCCYIYILSIQN